MRIKLMVTGEEVKNGRRTRVGQAFWPPGITVQHFRKILYKRRLREWITGHSSSDRR